MSINPLLLQNQIRENASDLQDFARDLKQWGEEMKRKEGSLKDVGKPSSKPKIRKTNPSKSGSKIKEQPKQVTKVKAGTNYAAWEKFDVDAELEKLDDINDDSELTDECNESMYDEAIVQKEKGNKCVKNQDWDGAIKCYTKAIDCYSFEPIFYANRALCYLKKKLFAEAEKDCSMSLNLDQTYVKAYQRRAAARLGLNKLEYAEQDYLKVLEYEPKNNESRKELERLREKMYKKEEAVIKSSDQRPVSKFTASRNKLAANTIHSSDLLFESNKVNKMSQPVPLVIDDGKPISPWISHDDITIVKPINKKPHLRSQKPLKRIEIVEEIDIQQTNTSKANENNEAIKTHVLEKKEVVENPREIINSNDKIIESGKKVIENECVKNNVNVKTEKDNVEESPTEPVSEFKKKQITRNLRNTQHHSGWPTPNPQSTPHIATDDLKIVEKTNLKEEKNLINSDKKFSHNDSNNWISPKNSVQFYSCWKNLKSSEEKYKYLKIINPEEIPKIFQNSLESNIFSSIVEILAKNFVENKEVVSGLLKHFSKVKRFNTIIMFMTDDDKNNLWKLFDYMKESSELSGEELDKLFQVYEL